jgi:hypothetical protein
MEFTNEDIEAVAIVLHTQLRVSGNQPLHKVRPELFTWKRLAPAAQENYKMAAVEVLDALRFVA